MHETLDGVAIGEGDIDYFLNPPHVMKRLSHTDSVITSQKNLQLSTPVSGP
ncbi:MAG: hypothetical protein ACR2IH_00630 [Pyrinomonadaceae bacterium]